MAIKRFGIDGRTVLVTGGGAGIGLGIVRVLAGQGARVILAERNPEGAARAEELRTAGMDVQYRPCDVSDPGSIAALFRAAADSHGKLDGLVNNAGITIREPFLEASEQTWQRTIDTNLRSVFLCTQHAARAMRQSGGGSIVNVSSNHAGASMEGFEAYAASKGGICAMTRAMAWSLGQYGIRVNTVSPGLTMTANIEQAIAANPALREFYPTLHATQRVNRADDIGDIVAFLVSDASISLTGADLLADNGMSAHLFNRYGN